MEASLISMIKDIRSNQALFTVEEASIKAGIVQRLLHGLGWDPFNIEEVKPEYTTGTKRVDYALRLAHANKVFVEVKRMSESLEPHQEQLLQYSFQEGVKLAILTNGATWWFYLPLNEGIWEERRFYTVDLREQDPSDVAKRFIAFLAKERVQSGAALVAAETVYKSHQKRQILREAIPKAWIKIISEPDELLVELLIETTEKICGYRPESEEVTKFLSEQGKDHIAPPIPVFKPPKPVPSASIVPKDPESEFTFRRVDSIKLFGQIYYPDSWRDLLFIVTSELYKLHRSNFNISLSFSWVKQTRQGMRRPKQIVGTNYYIETNLSAKVIVQYCKKLLTLFGHKERDLLVTTK